MHVILPFLIRTKGTNPTNLTKPTKPTNPTNSTDPTSPTLRTQNETRMSLLLINSPNNLNFLRILVFFLQQYPKIIPELPLPTILFLALVPV